MNNIMFTAEVAKNAENEKRVIRFRISSAFSATSAVKSTLELRHE